ncbi:HPP family protein [Paraburkholderia sp.]|uniref:HPP family protein n=1 Tax=Paraburkholderia sp. TaxID=1926495 RepID=UPI00238C6E8D|nr:HPP family protein [Paraburkholderia sp.]MDE1183403.1 HPP family protein [Paraburkholderia sp.]
MARLPVLRWLSTFAPPPVAVRWPERVRACLGALVGIACTGVVMHLLLGAHPASIPLLVAPMGASAVLLFAVPASPLAQPWSIIGGNLVSATLGVICARWIPDPLIAASFAVALAITGMFALRCVHPPSGAVALTAVLGGHDIRALGFGFVVSPILLQSIALLGAALVYHALTGHRYPHANRSDAAKPKPLSPASPASFTRGDLDAVLRRQRELLDIDPDDLETLLREVQLQAYARTFTELRCADIMSNQVVSVTAHTQIKAASDILKRHRVKALPVTDAAHHLIGIVTRADLIGAAAHDATPASVTSRKSRTRRKPGKVGPNLAARRHPLLRLTIRVRRWLRRGAATPARTVEDVMTTHVHSVSAATPIAELVPLFAHHGHHHIPVLDRDRQIAGMVTQADLIAGLYRQAHQPRTSQPQQPQQHSA